MKKHKRIEKLLEKQDHLYLGIERAVMWGDEKETVLERLHEKGLTTYEANSLYNFVFRERQAIIRNHNLKRLIYGAIIALLGGILLIAFFWITTDSPTLFHTHRLSIVGFALFLIPLMILAYGAWQFADACAGILMTKHHRSSMSDLH